MLIAPLIANAPQGLFGYLQEINGAYSIPILTIIVVGYLTKWVPGKAANISIISESELYIISQYILKPFVFGEANYPHFLHVMAILFAVNVVIMLLIGKFSPRKEAFVQEYTNEVDITPWQYSKVAAVAIFIMVIGVYYYFS